MRVGFDIMNMTLKVGIISIIIMFFSGCASMGGTGYSTFEADIAGRVIRSEVKLLEYEPGWHPNIIGDGVSIGPGFLFLKTWTDNAKRYRWVQTYTHTGTWHYSGMSVPAFALVPDQVPTLGVGDIVDVLYLNKNYDFNYDKLQAEKILRLVCRAKDKECIKKIKSENKWGAVTGVRIENDNLDPSKLTYTPVR
jgi:hypothetical protein